ncbi:hypothetical protein Taro_013563 [Colocasia esculenta]|uniref:Disease resistance RPP13-like protein 1 n=1 Tax=Colocasia esculenta TaxID=4460 RepID=A0A843UBZ9_COLES|nr:hypothetical protein [Colocasia esculenta]
MAKSITSVAAGALEELAAHLGRLHPATTNIRVGSIRQGLERLSRMLVRIRATLDDAEEMEIRDASVRLWLRELEGVAGDAEDVLDELPCEASRLRAMEDHGFHPRGAAEDGADGPFKRLWNTVRYASGSSSAAGSHEFLAFLDDVERRIEEINSRFDEIIKDRAALQFEESHGQRHAGMPARRPTSCLVEKSGIFGREKDLEAINSFLSDAETSGNNNISVMAIVGMGGLGKTTLAQAAYSDASDGLDGKHFDVKLWVYVSENFDLVRLTRSLIESSTLTPCHLAELNPLHTKLKQELDEKKFLLVLDDVWEDENFSSCWDTLTAPLLYGRKGSKIIITTRSEKIAKMTRATLTYHLPVLQEEHCRELFRRWAFEGRNLDSLPNLKDIGDKISKKCKGLPLAAKTLAGLLSSEDDEEVWNRILQCDIWDIDEETGIMSILRLSYQHLPAHLKRCLRYCSVFPKGYEFDMDHLVWMWMAQGYVQAKGELQMEDIGKKYFDDLLRRSFFHCSRETFLMHDFIHDLARSVSGDECCSVEGDKFHSIQVDVRHMSVVCCSDPSSIASAGHHYGTGTLRSLLFFRCYVMGICLMKPLDDLFNQMKHLRVLDLSCTDLQSLPTSIGCLKHLRYLGLRSNRMIRQLPESVGSLHHLQTIDLESSGIQFLPNSISNLLNLRHIICKDGLQYPVGIGRLINLQTMAGFIVSSGHDYAKLGELKHINNVRSLRISGIANLTDVDEAKEACLEKKNQLQSLDLSWSGHSSITDQVLESLKPNPKLEWLCISCFNGRSPPSWLGHPSFSKLTTLKLIGSKCWSSLPPLGQLPSLKCLYISTIKGVEYIDDEFFSGGFPRLETLTFKYMSNWKSWRGAQNGECRQLRKLTIDSCDNLISLSINNLHSLQDLEIIECGRLQFSNDYRLPSTLQVLHIRMGRMYNNVVLRDVYTVQEAIDTRINLWQRLLTLELVWDYQAGHRSFKREEPEEVLKNLQPHNNLNKLVIEGFVGSRFPTWLGDPSFTNLVHVKLINCSHCEVLPQLGQLPALMELYISGANMLRCIGKEFFYSNCSTYGRQAFTSLRKLEFNDMPSWEGWVEMEDDCLPCLHELILRHCPVLKALPRLPTSLREMEVENCDVIILPHSLDHITSLCTLRISQMPKLKNLPGLPWSLRKLVLERLPVLADLLPPQCLRDLVLQSCNEAMLVASLPHLTLLTSLHISDLPNLETIPLHNLGVLQELHVSNCPKLKKLDCTYFSSALLEYIEGLQALKSLERLSVSDCPMLHFTADEKPPSILESMVIINCSRAQAWQRRHWSKSQSG